MARLREISGGICSSIQRRRRSKLQAVAQPMSGRKKTRSMMRPRPPKSNPVVVPSEKANASVRGFGSGDVFPVTGTDLDEGFWVVGPEFQSGGALAGDGVVFASAFPGSFDAEARTNTGCVGESLGFVSGTRKVVDFGETEIPTLMKFGILRFLPKFVH